MRASVHRPLSLSVSLCLSLAIATAALASEPQAATPPAFEPGRSVYGGEGLHLIRSARILPGVATFSANGGFFRQRGVTGDGADEYHLMRVGASWAPLRWLELSATSRSATLEQPAAKERNHFLVGDLWMHAKAGWNLGSGFSLAGEATVRWPPPVGLSRAGISPGLHALATWDGTESRIPLRAHLNTGFVLDNSHEFSGPEPDASRRLALDITTYNRVTSGAGLEGVFRAGPVGVRPFIEYLVDWPLGIEGGLAQVPMRVVPGVRVAPWRGLFIDGAVELGVRRPSAPSVAPLPGWMAVVSVGYGVPLAPQAARTEGPPVERVQVVTTVEPPSTGGVRGRVEALREGKPLADAVVALPGHGRVLTEADGTFAVSGVSPGQMELTVTHAGFATERVSVEVVAGVDAAVEVGVTALPPPVPEPARLRGTVLNEKGNALPATVSVPTSALEPKTFESGEYELTLPEGEHTLEVSAPGHLRQGRRLQVRAGEAVFVDFLLREKPKAVLVVLRKEKLEIKKQVHFATNRDVILSESAPLLDEVAATLLDNPQLRRIRIEGHTDSQGDDAYNLELSQRRAASVARALGERGVHADRLKPVGYGESAPIHDNRKPSGRAKNRRVEFMIEAQD